MSIKRRSFLKKAATGSGLAVATTGLAAPAIAQGMREAKLVTTWPKNFPGLGTGAQRFADRITNMTDGRITVKLYAAGEIVPAFEVHDAVSAGTADMYHGAEYYFVGKSKAFAFYTAVPFGMTAQELNAWIYFHGGQELWDELQANYNIKPFMCGNTGLQAGGWFNKEINTPEDLKGLNIRIPGLGNEVMRKLGANAQAIPGGEIYAALESGAIDATEWVGPWNDLAFGFYKVTKYYYHPGFHEPGSGLGVGVNMDFYNSLSDADKAVVENAAIAENQYMHSEFDAKNAEALKTLIDEHGVQFRIFNDELYKAFGDASLEVLQSAADENAFNKRVFDSFRDSLEKSTSWLSISENDYVTRRNKALGIG